MDFKNAVGYVRVSTDGQVGDDKYGIDAQKQSILLYANENGYNIVEWFIDEGVSGVKENRPELDKVLYGEVTNPPFEAVIVAKSDRIARDIKLYFYYLYTLEKKNIKLISVSEKFDDDNGLSGIYRSIMLFVAEQERRNIALRTGTGRMMKARAGGYSGGRPPYGYKVENGCLVINEEEVPIVKIVFKGLEEGHTLWEIVDTLTEQGYRTRKGTKFNDSNVRSIRDKKPLYQGMYKYGKNANWVKGVHEPILKKEEE